MVPPAPEVVEDISEKDDIHGCSHSFINKWHNKNRIPLSFPTLSGVSEG